MGTPRLSPLSAAFLLALAALGPRAIADPATVQSPGGNVGSFTAPEIRQETIHLEDAIRFTLENAPAIQRARQEARSRLGLFKEASGQFDPSIVFAPAFERANGRVIGGVLRTEAQKRELFQIFADSFEQLANDIERDLYNNSGRVFPACAGLTITINGQVVCLDPNSLGGSQILAFQQLLDSLIARSTDAQSKAKLEEIRKTYNDVFATELFKFVQATRIAVEKARQELARLGALPRTDVRDSLTVDLSLPFPTREGLIISPVLSLQGVRDNFGEKPSSGLFGGKSSPTEFTAIVGLAFNLPLGKHAGATSTAANERASRLNHEAALEDVAQAASQSVLDTALAYWSLAAAQERLALFERSAASQKRIIDISDALVKGDEIPRSEMSKINARSSDAAASAADARRALVEARVNLARAMGLSVTDLDGAPLAADPLPDGGALDVLDKTPLPELLAGAQRRRSDLRAARTREKAAVVLARAARVNLRPIVDLSVQGDYRGLFEDPFYKDVFHPRSYWNALTGRLLPSIQVGLHFEIPVANNAARGRLIQSEALLSKSDISARNLERIIESRALEQANSLRSSAREVGARQIAARHYEETIKSSFDQYRAGELSLIDAILTERDMTTALLGLIAARQSYASNLAQLRFETGSLLRYSVRDGAVGFGEHDVTGLTFEKAPTK
jgi:outer membrane protein TolC